MVQVTHGTLRENTHKAQPNTEKDSMKHESVEMKPYPTTHAWVKPSLISAKEKKTNHSTFIYWTSIIHKLGIL